MLNTFGITLDHPLTETSNYQYPVQFQNESVTMEDLYAQPRKSIIMLKNPNTDKATGYDNISGHNVLKAA